jgi:hypothetical protein
MTRSRKYRNSREWVTGLVHKVVYCGWVEDMTGELGDSQPYSRFRARDTLLTLAHSLQIKQHIVEGDFVATVFEMETIFGVDQVFDRVHVCDGELKEIHSFYYPQPNPTTGVP